MKKLFRICLAIVIVLSLNFIAITPVHASNDLGWAWANPYPTGSGLTSITYGNGMFVATGDDGTILTSADGETWDIQNSGTSNYLDGVAWLDGKFWCVGIGVMLNSTDGINWSNPNTGSSFTGRNIGYNGSRYVIPSSSSVRYSDDDGATWNLINLGAIFGWSDPAYRLMYDIVWDGSQFVVIGDYGTVVTSPDGINWTEQTSPTDAHLKALVDAHDLATAKKAIESICDLIASRCQKGIYDEDPRIHRNVGFVDGKAILIDVGRLKRDPRRVDPRIQRNDLRKITARLKNYLENRSPELADYLETHVENRAI